MEEPEERADPRIGRVVAGNYRLIDVLGHGTMGTVYLGEHSRLQTKAAIKLLHHSKRDDARSIDRFEREAAAAAHIRHANVVQVFDFGSEEDGTLYIVMEFVNGAPLTEWLEARESISVGEVLSIARGILEALAVAHGQSVTHRDIKPANVSIVEAHGRVQPKLMDFGVAKLDWQGKKTVEMAAGTPEYMSPEQCSGEKVDARSDLYAVGCLLYALLTGRPPFVADSALQVITKHVGTIADPPSSVNETAPSSFDAVVHKALQKNREHRFASADEFLIALDNATRTLPPQQLIRFPSDEVEIELERWADDDAEEFPYPSVFDDEPEAPPAEPAPRPKRPGRATLVLDRRRPPKPTVGQRLKEAAPALRGAGLAVAACVIIVGAYYGARWVMLALRDDGPPPVVVQPLPPVER